MLSPREFPCAGKSPAKVVNYCLEPSQASTTVGADVLRSRGVNGGNQPRGSLSGAVIASIMLKALGSGA